MRWSQTLIPTDPEDPKDAEIASHKLMLRAGLIRKLAGGLYTFLPLGLRALRKIEAIIRQEMDSAGALEILMPSLQPREIWERSGRYAAMSDVLFGVNDRQNRNMVLGPTHEEVVTDLVSREIRSYRQMPVTFYQIQTKFRDEIRPRFGLMRAREFIMKDAYSFDLGWNEADASYRTMYDAYSRIFKRCGLAVKIVEADTGAMGGNFSHEFMVPADSGEDAIIECRACSYAANIERAERAADKSEQNDSQPAPGGAPVEVSTPGMKSVAEVSSFLRCRPRDLIKTIIYVADGKPVAAAVAGDRDINEKKLARALGAKDIALADDATVGAVTGAPPGFAGPVGLGLPLHADIGLQAPGQAVTGANKADTHLLHVRLDRDAVVTAYHDIAVVRAGDSCPKCGAALAEARGIEVGHVFKLGSKYTDAFDAFYLDAEGRKQSLIMGCYGIGVTRTLQAVIEQSHDGNGIVWPLSVAPYTVALLALDTQNPDMLNTSETLKAEIEKHGVDVLLDDRDERPGVKFKDADLLGFPVRVVVSRRSMAKDSVEIKLRNDTRAQLVPVGQAASQIVDLCIRKEG